MVLRTADRHLVDAARAGDLLAFEELARRHEALVYRVALRMLGSPSDADDAAQDVLLQAWQGLPRFRGDSSFATWLYRLASNRCLDDLSSRRRDAALPDDVRGADATMYEQVEGRMRLEALTSAVARLTPEQRAPLVLREFEGLSYEEIAEVLETTVAAVKGRIHRARLELVSALTGWR